MTYAGFGRMLRHGQLILLSLEHPMPKPETPGDGSDGETNGTVTAMPPTISFPYTITVTIETTAPDVAQILLNGSTAPLAVTLEEDNAGEMFAQVTVVTHSGDPWEVPLELGGADGDKFTLGNGGIAPCDINVGGVSLVAGSYAIALSAPPA